MEILTATQHRTLAFIAAVNLGGYAPSAHEIELWLDQPTPARTAGIRNSIEAIRSGYVGIRGPGYNEGPVNHMHSLKWVKKSRNSGVK